MTEGPIVRDNPERHQFEIDLGGGEYAYAKYNLLPGAIRFYHTVVPESHGGQGLGTALVLSGLHALRRYGVNRAALTTEADNSRAHKLYQALGYRTQYHGLWMANSETPHAT